MIPELSSQQKFADKVCAEPAQHAACIDCLFFPQLSSLTSEEFELGKRFLHSWSQVHVDYAREPISADTLLAVQRDFFLIAQWTPGVPVEMITDEISLQGGRLAATTALGQAQKQAELEQKQAELEQKQAELEQLAPSSNAIWPLHRIIAGMDDMGLPGETVAQLQEKFGWTLSFSRALHGGSEAMRKWFRMAGVEPRALNGLYQCMSQESAAQQQTGARVEETDILGVRRVVCTYPSGESTKDEATSLLMYAPIVQQPKAAGKGGAPTIGENDVSRVEASIPVAMPQLHGVHPLRAQGALPVQSVPLVLTPPRILLLVRIAESMTSSRGVKLTGVHGVGKSMLLQALSTVLPVGHPCDMLYVPEAGDLLTDPNTCGRQLAQSSGPLVDRRAVGNAAQFAAPTFDPSLAYNQERAQEQWNVEPEGHRPGSLTGRGELMTWHKCSEKGMTRMLWATFQRLKDSPGNVTCARVYIFDEVNQLIKGMREQFANPGARLDKCLRPG